MKLKLISLLLVTCAHAHAQVDMMDASVKCGAMSSFAERTMILRQTGIERDTIELLLKQHQLVEVPNIKTLLDIVYKRTKINTSASLVGKAVFATCINGAAK